MVKKMKKKEEDEEKANRKKHFTDAGIRAHEPSVQSSALNPLNHSTLPYIIDTALAPFLISTLFENYFICSVLAAVVPS